MKKLALILLLLTSNIYAETINKHILQAKQYESFPSDIPVTPKLKNLTLSAEQTIFTKNNAQHQIEEPIKVIATYSDGHSEEVTDLVTWQKTSKRIRFYNDHFSALEGNFTVSASLDDVVSNEITLKVVNKTQKLLTSTVENNDKMFYPNRNAVIMFTLNKKPTSDVKLKLRLNKSEGVKFLTSSPYGSLETELVFKPGHFNDYDVMTQSIDVHIIDLDPNNTSDYTLIIEAFESEDAKYNGYDPDDIVIHKTNKIKLIEPPLQQRRGAIRGVPIYFRVLSKEIGLKYELVDPPKGMKILRRSDLGEWEIGKIDGVDIEWNVPMDIEEKIYTITMKATDLEGNEGQISFDIKVPKTTIIPTKIENNELIVTDKNSNLYGMKMKGHHGEDISTLQLRSVAYADVWKKKVKNKALEDIIERIVFVIDNMPEALDMKMPSQFNSAEKWNTHNVDIYKYDDRHLNELYQWDKFIVYSGGYKYEDTPGLVIPHIKNRYEKSGSKIYMFEYQKNLDKKD